LETTVLAFAGWVSQAIATLMTGNNTNRAKVQGVINDKAGKTDQAILGLNGHYLDF